MKSSLFCQLTSKGQDQYVQDHSCVAYVEKRATIQVQNVLVRQQDNHACVRAGCSGQSQGGNVPGIAHVRLAKMANIQGKSVQFTLHNTFQAGNSTQL